MSLFLAALFAFGLKFVRISYSAGVWVCFQGRSPNSPLRNAVVSQSYRPTSGQEIVTSKNDFEIQFNVITHKQRFFSVLFNQTLRPLK
jgi:hypothetical protein